MIVFFYGLKEFISVLNKIFFMYLINEWKVFGLYIDIFI